METCKEQKTCCHETVKITLPSHYRDTDWLHHMGYVRAAPTLGCGTVSCLLLPGDRQAAEKAAGKTVQIVILLFLVCVSEMLSLKWTGTHLGYVVSAAEF